MTTPTPDTDTMISLGRKLYLTGTVLDEYAAKGTKEQQQFATELFHAELASRQASRSRRLLTKAKLPVHKTFTGFNWTPVGLPTDITRNHLTDLEFLTHCEDLVFYGDVGTGKTHLASALVAHACQQGIPARFFTAASLVDHLRGAKNLNRLDKELKTLGKNKLIAIDELGYIPIDTEGARLLFQAIADAYEQRSLIITTNLAFSQWGHIFGSDDMAAAIIDRLVHHGRMITFTGQSYRISHALMT